MPYISLSLSFFITEKARNYVLYICKRKLLFHLENISRKEGHQEKGQGCNKTKILDPKEKISADD